MRVRPILGMSLCLGDAPVRYDGAAIRDDFAKRLADFVELRPVCPELEIGLGVPRAPIRIEKGRLVQPSTGADLSERMRRFAASWLAGLGEVDGFLLKNRSPSCGVRDVKLSPGLRGPGFFAEAVLERHPGIPVEDEGRLSNLRIREHFLARLFAGAELRAVGSRGALVRFHARHQLLLLGCRETALRALGKLVANHARRPFRELKAMYRAGFFHALAEPPEPGPLANVLEHALGLFSEELGAGEKRQFLASLRRFRSGRLPLAGPVSVLRSWLARSPKPTLDGQSILDPYPDALVELRDSGKGRD